MLPEWLFDDLFHYISSFRFHSVLLIKYLHYLSAMFIFRYLMLMFFL